MNSLITLVATALTFLVLGGIVTAIVAVAAKSRSQEYLQRKMQQRMQRRLRRLQSELGRRKELGRHESEHRNGEGAPPRP